jgi:hypothetical protein
MNGLSVPGARGQSLPLGEAQARAHARSTFGHGLLAVSLLVVLWALTPWLHDYFSGAALVASAVTVGTMVVSSYLSRAYLRPYLRVRRILTATNSAQAVEKR